MYAVQLYGMEARTVTLIGQQAKFLSAHITKEIIVSMHMTRLGASVRFFYVYVGLKDRTNTRTLSTSIEGKPNKKKKKKQNEMKA